MLKIKQSEFMNPVRVTCKPVFIALTSPKIMHSALVMSVTISFAVNVYSTIIHMYMY